MESDHAGLLRTLGVSTRLWASAGRHEVHPDTWIALSGEPDASMNLACSRSASADVLTKECLEPLLAAAKPGIIMLAGPGLSTAQTMIDIGWVNVGAVPLMLLDRPPANGRDVEGVRAMSLEDFPLVREVLADAFALNPSRAQTVLPDSVANDGAMSVWGLFEAGRVVASMIVVREDDLAVVWSMATRRDVQGLGHGRHLLEAVLINQFDDGAQGSLLHASRAGERLYRSLGYDDVEYLQMWSRPRWVLGSG
jgi:GNAT superfamily N-acetyltransferase